MQSSSAQSEDTPSTKAALDHLQRLIEQLLRENRHLKRSLQQTRSQLDEVRDHLNRFKLQATEHERNDRLMRKQIRTIAALIQRRRDATSPPSLPSSPERHPTPPSASSTKSASPPNHPPHLHLPTQKPTIRQVPSLSQVPSTRDASGLPNANGKRPETPTTNDSGTISCVASRTVVSENATHVQSSRSPKGRDAMSVSRSFPAETPPEKVSSPTTCVSDALQKAFVAMEKDTTNSVQVLHDNKCKVSSQSVTGSEPPTENVSHRSVMKDVSQDANANAPNTNGLQRDAPQHHLKENPGSSRKHAVHALKRNVLGRSAVSDPAISLPPARSPMKSGNGELKRGLPQNKSTASPSETAKRLEKTVSLKKTKKGYKVNLALSRKSSGSGSNSSDSSDDEDSDSSGPACSASFSHLGPGKSQVSLEGGLPSLISAARKVKETIAHRKGDNESVEDGSSHDSEAGGNAFEGSSGQAGPKQGSTGLENGSLVPSAAIASSAALLYTAGHSEEENESLPVATGSPKLDGSIGEQNSLLQDAAIMSQSHTSDRTKCQQVEQSNPFTYGNTSHLENLPYTPSIPHNPVPEASKHVSPVRPEQLAARRTNMLHPRDSGSHPHAAAFAIQSSAEDSDDQSLAAGKATESRHIEKSTVSQSPTIHEITHVPVRPRGFAVGDKRGNGAPPVTAKPSSGDTTEFLTIRSCSADMLPWKARPGSKYIDISKGALAVKHPAALSFQDGKVVMNGKMRLLKPVRKASSSSSCWYVSPMYPDGTFLPYVPVSGVVLHGKPVHWDSSRYADQRVQLSFSKEVFDTLVSSARRAYRKRHPGAQINFPGAFLAGNSVRKVVRIEPECSVNMTRLHRTPSKYSVSETLAAGKRDVIGLVLLYLSIEARTEDCLSVEVIFGLHSMVAYRLSTDRRR